MMMDLEKFFEEKEIPFTTWEIEHNGEVNFIDSDVVIEGILASQGNERSKIAGVLFTLDFRNEPILGYLKHLAECMIKHNC